MAQFSTGGFLTVSLAANASGLILVASDRLIGFLLRKCESKNEGLWRKLLELNRGDESRIVSRVLAEHVLTLITLLLALIVLFSGDVWRTPFTALENFTTVEIALCLTVGRHSYAIVQEAFHFRQVTLYVIKLIQRVVTITCCSVFVIYRQNALLAVAGVLTEAGDLSNDLLRVAGKITEYHERRYFNLTIGNLVISVMSRACLPSALMTVSLVIQNPFQMHYVPLSFFFLSVTFFFVINLWKIKISTDAIRTSLAARKEWRLRGALNIAEPELRTNPPTGGGLAESGFNKVYKNNFCYLKPYSNVNLTTSNDLSSPSHATNLEKVRKVQWNDLVSPTELKEPVGNVQVHRTLSTSSSSSGSDVIRNHLAASSGRPRENSDISVELTV